jgi:PAS domain S-box-containing protein
VVVAPVVAQPSLTDSDGARSWTLFQQFEAIVNSSDDAIVGKTVDGVITTWNPAAERMYGYPAADIIGKPMKVLCPPDRIGEIKEILTKIGRGERVSHHETVRQRKDGTTFPVAVTVSPIRDMSGRLVGASSITRDLSEQIEVRSASMLSRRAEDLERANRNLEMFTYSVSHDLRAPLRALSGFSAALLEEYREVLGEDGRGYAERIQAASDQMANLIDDMLQISRISRAEMDLHLLDLGAEVAGIAQQLQRDEPGRRVHVTIERPVQARADPALIRTVLQNLLDNAWKFTSGRDNALIEFGTTSTVDAQVCCYVRDNGAGFDPAYMDKLFTPFQRLHTTREFPGTGVGLASVRQIVERHGGLTWAEGAVGEGATFYFTLNAKETA